MALQGGQPERPFGVRRVRLRRRCEASRSCRHSRECRGVEQELSRRETWPRGERGGGLGFPGEVRQCSGRGVGLAGCFRKRERSRG